MELYRKSGNIAEPAGAGCSVYRHKGLIRLVILRIYASQSQLLNYQRVSSPLSMYHFDVRFPGWIHISSATFMFSRKASAGVLNPRHFLGVELMAHVNSLMSSDLRPNFPPA